MGSFSNCFSWLRYLLAKRSYRPYREEESSDDTTPDSTPVPRLSDLHHLLHGNYSFVLPETKKRGRNWKGKLLFWKNKKSSPVFAGFRWTLVSKETDCVVFPVITSNIDHYSENQTTSCLSLLELSSHWKTENKHLISQVPLASPTAPIALYSNPEFSGCFRNHISQLRRGKALFMVYWEEVDDENEVRLFLGNEKTDKIFVFDLRTGQTSAFNIGHKLYGENYCTSFMDDEKRINFVYWMKLINGDFEIQVKTGGTSSAVQGSNIPVTDVKIWSPHSYNCSVLFKVIDPHYFVWFFKTAPWDFMKNEEYHMIWCGTYERGDDGVWKWSDQLISLPEWAQTERGKRMMEGVRMLKEIEPELSLMESLRNIEVKYEEGVIFAKTKYGYLRRYAFRPPSLQSMAADVVRAMVEKKTKETKSLETWKWWNSFIEASGLIGHIRVKKWSLETDL